VQEGADNTMNRNLTLCWMGIQPDDGNGLENKGQIAIELGQSIYSYW
jgi:hypothetical protein